MSLRVPRAFSVRRAGAAIEMSAGVVVGALAALWATHGRPAAAILALLEHLESVISLRKQIAAA
jgi:hypothetical protein